MRLREILLVAVAVGVASGCSSGSAPMDAGTHPDDAGPMDSGTPPVDAGPADAGDGGAIDSGSSDSGPLDSGVVDSGPVDAGELPLLTAVLVSHQFMVAEHMRASYEMQLSGEPFATLLGYNLSGFSRTDPITDQYLNPATGQVTTDPLGYSLAVESYEYSKQPMNNLSFEGGAGLSLQFGPVLNPGQASGPPAYTLLANRFQQFATESLSGGPVGKNLIVSPAPIENPLNYYGWPGLWPVFADFSSFDPTIYPLPGGTNSCTFSGSVGAFGYGGGVSPFNLLISNYECDYNTLNLPSREIVVDAGTDAGQLTKILSPDALGYVVLKQGLWTINYWETLQDTAGNGITWVDAGDIPSIGQPGNTVVGAYPDPNDPTGQTMLAGAPGVYLGDIPMEGWQGLTMQEEADNSAELLLTQLLSSDGATLISAASISPDGGSPDAGPAGGLEGAGPKLDGGPEWYLPSGWDSAALAADNYSYNSPLLYFPYGVGVTETPTASAPIYANEFFPQPTAFAIADGSSELAGLSGLLAGFGEAFAWTDQNNPIVGGAVPFLATYDGDPFPADDGQPDGQDTLHDRALGVLKIALVDLDRLHYDPVNQVLVDSASVSAGTVTRGTTVTTVELVESIVAMRNAFRSLNGSLQLYSNNTPDSQGVPGALDAAPLGGAPYSGSLQNHIITLIEAEASFLASKLISPSGAVANGYNLQTQTADPSPTDLAAEAGAIRGLIEAYLATSNDAYRTLATSVYADLQARFWMTDILCFRTTAGIDSPMQFTPLRFGLLSAGLRQYYELIASNPGQEAVGTALLAEIKRSYKLILNGWNDRNQDDIVQYPEECTTNDGGFIGVGLEMAERALTGELGHFGDDGERDHDCVKELSYRSLPAAMGAELEISRQ
jgi:hypothetical protein